METKPDLSNCAVIGMTGETDYARIITLARVINYCCGVANFGEAVMASHSPAPDFFTGKNVQIPKVDWEGYSVLEVGWLHRFTDKPFIMVVQWDGFIIEPSMWRKEFMDYDYIGAPWQFGPGGHTVGNGGFSLRSRKFAEATSRLPFMCPNVPSDAHFCLMHRKRLEAEGLRFAPPELAIEFSTEFQHTKSFGYHGAASPKRNKAWGILTRWERGSALDSKLSNVLTDESVKSLPGAVTNPNITP